MYSRKNSKIQEDQKQGQVFPVYEKQQQKLYKKRLIAQFSKQVLARFYVILITLLIFTCICYSVPLLYLNELCSLENKDNNRLSHQLHNQFSRLLLNLSNFLPVYFCEINYLFQTSILIGILIFFLLFMAIVKGWIDNLKNDYKSHIPRIQQFSLWIQVKHPICKRQINQSKDYFQTFSSICLRQKIFRTKFSKQTNQAEKNHFNFMKQILNKITLIQDVILLPYRTNNLNDDDKIDMRDERTHGLIVVFSYKQVAEAILEWWMMGNDRNEEIIDVKVGSSPKNILFDKLKNEQPYKDEVRNYGKKVFLVILMQVLYVVLLGFVIFLGIMPQQVFTNNIVTNYSTYIKQVSLILSSFILFLCMRFFHERFIFKNLPKSIQKVVTMQQQIFFVKLLVFLFIVFNLVLVPSAVWMLMGFWKQNFLVQNAKIIVEDLIFGECGLNKLWIYYAIFRWFFSELIEWLVLIIKCNKNQNKTINFTKSAELIQIFLIFLQITTLMALSVLINPAIIFICCVGLFFKFKKSFTVEALEDTCFLTLAQSLSCYVKNAQIYFNVTIILLFNGLLLVDIFIEKGKNSELFLPVLITNFGFGLLSLLLIQLLENKCSKICQKVSICMKKLFVQFPKKLTRSEEEAELSEQNKVPSDKVTEMLITYMYANQTFIFQYDDELKLYNHQQLKRQSTISSGYGYEQTKKVIQQLNTMSRSLEQTLKEKLMKNSSNPFKIQSGKKQEQIDFVYEPKIHMKKPKPARVRIPSLSLPKKATSIEKQEVKQKYKRLNTAQIMKDLKKDKQKVSPRQIKRPYELFNMGDNQTNSWKFSFHPEGQQSEIEYEPIGKRQKRPTICEQQMSKIPSKGLKNQQKSQKTKIPSIKFTDLFDSDEQSIKNIVKKKIKQSIPKISY